MNKFKVIVPLKWLQEVLLHTDHANIATQAM